ncbi:MAG: DUF1573 domain-containing protein [Planctomycetota bacterium]
MTIRIAAMIAVFSIVGCRQSTPESRAFQGPLIQVETENIDLGRVSTDASVRPFRKITIANRGLTPLKILKTESGCACTLPEISSSVIAPGGTAQLTLEVKTIGTGIRSSVVRIHSNDITRPTVDVTANWIGVSPFGFDAVRLDFNSMASKHVATKMVRLQSIDPTSHPQCRIIGWKCPRSEVAVAFNAPLPVKVGADTELSVSVSAGSEPGEFLAPIEFVFEGCRDEKRMLNVSWQVQPEIDFVPKGLVLDGVRNEGVSGKFIIATRESIAVEDVEWTFEPASFQPTLKTEIISPTRLRVSIIATCPDDREILNGAAIASIKGKKLSGRIPIAVKVKSGQ